MLGVSNLALQRYSPARSGGAHLGESTPTGDGVALVRAQLRGELGQGFAPLLLCGHSKKLAPIVLERCVVPVRRNSLEMAGQNFLGILLRLINAAAGEGGETEDEQREAGQRRWCKCFHERWTVEARIGGGSKVKDPLVYGS